MYERKCDLVSSSVVEASFGDMFPLASCLGANRPLFSMCARQVAIVPSAILCSSKEFGFIWIAVPTIIYIVKACQGNLPPLRKCKEHVQALA